MLEFMNFFTENWYIILTFICALILAVIKIIEFISYPTDRKIKEVKARLLTYVTAAELELGGSTGQIKLSKVYDKFCAEFPYLKKWFPIEKFDKLVGEVLPSMRDILNKLETEDSTVSDTEELQ